MRLRENQTSVLSGIIQSNEMNSISGWPWLSTLPGIGLLTGEQSYQKQDTELLIWSRRAPCAFPNETRERSTPVPGSRQRFLKQIWDRLPARPCHLRPRRVNNRQFQARRGSPEGPARRRFLQSRGKKLPRRPLPRESSRAYGVSRFCTCTHTLFYQRYGCSVQNDSRSVSLTENLVNILAGIISSPPSAPSLSIPMVASSVSVLAFRL